MKATYLDLGFCTFLKFSKHESPEKRTVWRNFECFVKLNLLRNMEETHAKPTMGLIPGIRMLRSWRLRLQTVLSNRLEIVIISTSCSFVVFFCYVCLRFHEIVKKAV